MTRVVPHGSATSSPWLVVGCGYAGARLAAELAGRGAQVTVTRRRPDDARAAAELAGPGVAALALDIRQPNAPLAAAIPAGGIVVDSVPPGDDRGEGERRLARACAEAGAARLVYLSSTGVYPHGAGGWVDEDTPAAPPSEHGRRRYEAEAAALDEASAAGLEAVSLRIAAIYGPGRGVHARLRAGTYRIVGAGDAYVSRVHVDDLAAAIIAAGTAEFLPRRVYNVADDTPMTSRSFGDAVARILDAPPPPSLPPDEVSADARAMLAADRKVSSRRLRDELGVRLRYPSGLDGVRAALAEE